MLKKILIALLFVTISVQAQKKIKGSRNVTIEQTTINSFTSIELDGDFEVGLLKGSRYMVEVEADDNLHNIIEIKVENNVLYIKPSQDITGSKTQKIRITFSDTLNKVTVAGKVSFETSQNLSLNNFEFVAKGKSKSKFSIIANKFTLDNMEDAKVEAEVNAEEIFLHLNGSSDLDGYLKSKMLNVEAFENSSAKVKGDVDDFILSASKSSKFDGEKLSTKDAVVFAGGNSKNSINVSKKLKLSVKDKSEVDIYNSPEIDLVEFTEKATIAKKS